MNPRAARYRLSPAQLRTRISSPFPSEEEPAMQHAVRTTLRSLARQPGLSLAVILTLALGIGASTALFAYLRAIVWPAFDAPDAERVVWVYSGTKEEPRSLTSYPDYRDLRERQSAV